MYFSLSEFIQASTETAYLLNETYMPFYKMEDKGDGDISEDTGTLYTVGGVDAKRSEGHRGRKNN